MGDVSHGRVTLGEDVDATGNGADKVWKGGKGFWFAEASAWAGTLKLQFKTPQGTYIDVPSATLTANGAVEVDLPPGIIRYTHITSAPTDLYTYIVNIPL